MQILGIDAASLPIIWDADFLYGPRTASGEDSNLPTMTQAHAARGNRPFSKSGQTRRRYS